uniref:Cullin N-terminal domain-containing protein n=1 Tax=Glossina austeni TaxID=7395 RepID=A0A1A9UDB3_GLOAU
MLSPSEVLTPLADMSRVDAGHYIDTFCFKRYSDDITNQAMTLILVPVEVHRYFYHFYVASLAITKTNTPYLNIRYVVARPCTVNTSSLSTFSHFQGLADMLSASEIITRDSEKYVEHLLGLFKTFSTLIKNAFSDDRHFPTALDKAFETSVLKLELATGIQNRNVTYTAPESIRPELS